MPVTRLTPETLRGYVESVVVHNPPPLCQVNVESVTSAWKNMMPSGIGAAYGVTVNDFPAGFLLGLFITDLITGLPQAVEYLWMVSPKHRNGGTALRLLKTFENDAREKGCRNIVCGCNQVFEPDKMRRFYGHIGYKPFSQAFIKELN